MEKLNKKILIGIVSLIVIIAAVLLYFLLANKGPVPSYSIEVKSGNITEKINLTGQVKASQGVDLAFEIPGKITADYVNVGDKISAGQQLVAIDDSLLQSQLQQAQAQLDVLNINTIKNKLDASLQQLYTNSLSSAQKSATTAKDILLTISDIQFNHFTDQTSQNNILQEAKTKAVYSLLGQSNAGSWTSNAISQLNGGDYGLIQNAIVNPTQTNIDSALFATQTALQDVNNLVNAVPIDYSLSAAERASISLAKTNINLEIMTTSANVQSVATTKVNNSATVETTNSQIEAAQANVDAIKTQISKTVLKALFAGQVDKENITVGAIASPNVPVITISNNNLQINTYIPEIDVADVKIGNSADITLDTYGNSVIFPAKIVSVDSAQSLINGVPVYGAKLKFDNSDDRIKTGMTANIAIISATHSNILVIPKSAVIQNNNEYFVQVDKGNSQKELRQINVGLNDGENIEITSGLKLGDRLFAY